MKLWRIILIVAVLGLLAGVAIASPKHEVTSPSNAGFERMKALVGAWEGTGEDGKPVVVSYDLVSGGTALLEKLGPADEPSMVSLYNSDGPSVLMTHFCGTGNQPRMRAKGVKADAKTFDFTFVDCSNLTAPGAGHMHHLLMTFDDPDHLSQEWTWREKGKESKITIHLARKKTT